MFVRAIVCLFMGTLHTLICAHAREYEMDLGQATCKTSGVEDTHRHDNSHLA